ncbi:hypothetical protein MKW94_010643, partial [Papaver nudicaule]|nr:hypothetical protein [Papaver nudicaule]
AIAERSVSNPDVVNDMIKQWGVYGQILVIVFSAFIKKKNFFFFQKKKNPKHFGLLHLFCCLPSCLV